MALSFETVRMSHPDAPALMLISKMSRSLYLHREIREKGGAYGGMSIYTPEDGVFSFASYRDPHIVSTLKAFSGAMAFMASGDYSAEDIKEGILQVCADIDKPDSPGPAAKKAFYRKIVSLSDELRRRFKRDLLALTREDVIRVSREISGPASDSKRRCRHLRRGKAESRKPEACGQSAFAVPDMIAFPEMP